MSSEIIQIIEDDPTHAALLDDTLRRARYRTNVAFDGESGLEDIKRIHPALVLLDIMLPRVDGHEVCRRIRKDPIFGSIPIIMLSALGSMDEHRLAGFDAGADDYIAKPFSPREVIARIAAVLRRARPRPQLGSYDQGMVVQERFVVAFHDNRLELSWLQWQILRRLSSPMGQVVMREELASLIWGEDGLLHDHQLDREIHALSQQLSPHAAVPTITSMPGGGYLLIPPVRSLTSHF